MFGIPSFYYPNNTMIEPRCFMGLKTLNIGGSTLYVGLNAAYTVVYFKTNSTPFDGFNFRTATWNTY